MFYKNKQFKYKCISAAVYLAIICKGLCCSQQQKNGADIIPDIESFHIFLMSHFPRFPFSSFLCFGETDDWKLSLLQDTQLWDRNPHKQGETANISNYQKK